MQRILNGGGVRPTSHDGEERNESSAGCGHAEEKTITGNWYYIIVNPKRSQISFCLGR